jgi:hypothetical protein
MAEIAELVRLWQNRRRSSAGVRRIAWRHVQELERRRAEMECMRRTLQQLIHGCHGDERPLPGPGANGERPSAPARPGWALTASPRRRPRHLPDTNCPTRPTKPALQLRCDGSQGANAWQASVGAATTGKEPVT